MCVGGGDRSDQAVLKDLNASLAGAGGDGGGERAGRERGDAAEEAHRAESQQEQQLPQPGTMSGSFH